MKTDILYHLHQDLIPRREKSKKGNYESPLISLRKSIRLILRQVKDGEIIPLEPNPFNEKIAVLIVSRNFDLEKAIEHDIKLLKQQLKELDNIYKEINDDGYWDR